MSKRLDENLGSVGYDGLIVANEPVADVFTVTIRKEATAAATYKARHRAGPVCRHRRRRQAGDPRLHREHQRNPDRQLHPRRDVEVGTTANVTVLAYRTGHFARNKLAVASGYTLKATDEEELRKAGILLSDAIEY